MHSASCVHTVPSDLLGGRQVKVFVVSHQPVAQGMLTVVSGSRRTAHGSLSAAGPVQVPVSPLPEGLQYVSTPVQSLRDGLQT